MVTKIEMEESLRCWDISLILNFLNEEDINPVNLNLPGRTDVLNEFIHRDYPQYVEIILSDEYDYQKNGFNYLLTALKSVKKSNKGNKKFQLVKKILEVVPKSFYMDVDVISDLSPWLYCFREGYLKPVEIMNKNGIDWNHCNYSGHTALHIYFRNHMITDAFFNFILLNKKLINFDKKDNIGISIKEILNSASYSNSWIKHNNNKLLLKELKI